MGVGREPRGRWLDRSRESFLPMMLFAVLFGLSMDYEVFLVSRIHEEYLRTRDNARSVARGLASTASVITAAAAIMIVVFLSFVLNDWRVVKEFGLGLAVAVFVDATVVRLLLVPATMELMGEWNWWLPRWLERIVPRISLEGSDSPPPPANRPEEIPRSLSLPRAIPAWTASPARLILEGRSCSNGGARQHGR